MTKRTMVKQQLLKLGRGTEGKYLETFLNFLDLIKMREENKGILFEFCLAFILGVFQQEYHDRFSVIMTDYYDDQEKVDFVINGHKLQIKIDWDLNKSPIDPEAQWRLFAISVLFFKSKEKGSEMNTSGIDVFRNILGACGFLEDDIDELLDNPAFDAAEEILTGWMFN